MSRVLLLSVVCACLFVVQPTSASQPDFHLQVVPAVVYKVDDPPIARSLRSRPAWNSPMADLSSSGRSGRPKCWRRLRG
jgi:hypothetical protein